MKDYLSEAFKKLNLLNEDTFSLTPDGVDELKDFMNNDVDNTDISVIDMEAETQEELKDSYIGKFILDCEVCHSKIFTDKEEIKVDEDSDLVNMDMECPYCHCQDGYTIIGKVCDAHCEDGECEEKEIEVDDEEDVEEGLLSGDNNISIGNNNSSNLDLGDVAGAAASLAPMLLASDAGEKKSIKESVETEIFHNSNGTDYEVLARNKVGDALLKSTSPKFTQFVVAWNCPVGKGSWGQGHYFRDEESAREFWDENYANLTEALTEDTVKNRKGKWVNKGKEGTHGEFRTKKAADAQRKAMFAQGYKADESLKEEQDKPTGVLENVNEDFKEVKIQTDDTEMEMTSDENGKVTVTTEPIKNEECETCENSEEVIAPLSNEEKSEIEVKAEENGEEEVESEEDIDDFDEESFDELGESYLKEVYDNVDSYKTTKAYMKNKKLFVEGNINFKSGKTKTTQFIFESKSVNDKMRLIGENANITRGKKAFKVTGKVVNNKFLSESFNYNYSTKDSNGKSIRLYNTIKRNK